MSNATQDSSPAVSVVIPCLNEEKTLPACIESAKRGIAAAGIAGEIVVADNGSTDNSVEVARSMGARIANCPKRGYGNALRAGFEAATGNWLLMGDADASYDFSELPRFRQKINEGYDFVIGTRLRGKIDKGAMPWLNRRIGNPLLSLILRVLFRAKVSDAHCGMRAFTRSSLGKMNLRTSGMELASEMIIKASCAGLRIAEIPITLHKDARDRPPHLRPLPDGWRHLRYMLMMAPDWLFILPGTLISLAGILSIAALLPGPLKFGRVCFDVHTMFLGMTLVLFGVYLVLTGMFVKAFAYAENLGLRDTSFVRLISRFKLEHGLLVATALVLVGLAGDIRFLRVWAKLGFGDLDVQSGMRMAILHTTFLLVGLEIFFASFFLSILGISRDTYIGKYELR